MAMDRFAENADVRASACGARQQLDRGYRGFLRMVFDADAMQAASLAYMLAQKRMGIRVDDANVKLIPLHVHGLSNPTGWQAVISSVHFNAAIQMDSAFAELVIAERFDRQWKQRRFFLGEHRCDLPLRCAVDARIGPAQFP